MYYAYILKLRNLNYYKGLTSNLNSRLKQHELGKVSSTKKFLPFTLIHAEYCKTRNEARILEKFFKSGYGRELIKEIDPEPRCWNR